MQNYNQYDDIRLLAVIAENNENSKKAFRAFYERYSDKVHSYCLFKSNCIMDAEEIFQDAWLKFYKYAQSGKKIDSAQAFLYQIARNLSIDKHRNSKNNISLSYEFDYERLIDPLNLQKYLENNELLSMIEIYVNSLSDKYKEAFVLSWFSGLSYSEISVIIGESTDCVKKRCYRAMEKLIKALAPIREEIAKNE